MRGSVVWYAAAALVLLLVGGTVYWYQKSTADLDPFVVQVAGTPEEIEAHAAVARAFGEENPDIDLEVVTLTEENDNVAKLDAQFEIGNPPDVFLISDREYRKYAAENVLAPVQTLLNGEEVDLGAYYPITITAFTHGSRLQCLPQDISSPVVYYNVDLFKKVLIKHPKDWNWDRFRNAAIYLKTLKAEGAGIEPTLFNVAPFILSNEGRIVDSTEAPTRLTLDESEALEAFDYLLSLRQFKVLPTLDEARDQDLRSRFASGDLGMYVSTRADTPALRAVEGLNWDVAPLPTAALPATSFRSNGYCMTRTSTHEEEAAAFLNYVAREETQIQAAGSGAIVPAMQSAAMSDAFLDSDQPPAHAQVFLDAVPNMQVTSTWPAWDEIEEKVDQVLARIFYEPGFSVEEGIAEIQAQVAHLLAPPGGTSPSPGSSTSTKTSPAANLSSAPGATPSE